MTLWVMLMTLVFSANATDYLAEDNEYLLNYFKQSGTPSFVYLNCEQDVVTPQSDSTLLFTFGGNLTWYNVRRRALNCWYIFNFGAFDIHYKLYYKHSSNKTFTLATEGKVQYIDHRIAEHDAPEVSYKRTISKFSNNPFEYQIRWKLPHEAKEGNYQFKIELSVSPIKEQPTKQHTIGKHYEDGSNNIFCTYESALKYITNNGGIVHSISTNKNISGGLAQITYCNSQKSILQSSSWGNPMNEEGYRLVYNDPQAEFCVELCADNVPADTTINNTRLIALSTFIASIGESSEVPALQDIMNEYSACYTGKEPLSNPNARYIEYVRHCNNEAIKQFLKNKYNNNEYAGNYYNDISIYGLVRLRNILLQTHNQAGTLFNENAVNKLLDFKKVNNKWFTRNYHVRDLNYVKFPQTTLVDHTVFKVWNKIYYKTTGVEDVFSGLGCIYYGPLSSYMQYFCSKTENYPTNFLSENCLLFKLVPKVYFDTLTQAETAIKYVCASDSIDDLIHLEGKSIVCNNISPTVYSPVYLWQISDNGITWKNIEENNPYKLNGFEIENNDNNKDLYLKSSIAKNKTHYFRQICVLKSFASTEESDLYNYPIEVNGKTLFYISVASPNFYTVSALKRIFPQNFGFTGYQWPDETYLCYNDTLAQNTLSFDLVKSTNLTDDELIRLKNNASYRIYQVDTKGNKNLISNKKQCILPSTMVQDSLSYQCVISLCNDSLSKIIRIYRHKKENIDLHQISSTAAIAKADSINGYLQLLCLDKTSPSITIKDNNVGNVYEWRSVSAKEKPNLLVYHWDQLSRNECYQILDLYGWNFDQDTGFTLDNATINQIREYGKQKQTAYNELQENNAIQDSIIANSWQTFTQNIEGITQLTFDQKKRNPTFYIRKVNANGCISDSVQIEVKYVNPISGNIIEFKHTASDTVFVPSGEGNPYIVGSYPVVGGYGAVNETEGLSFTYQWMRKSNNGEWEPVVINSRLYAQVTDNGTKIVNSGTKYVSLPEETLKDIQENWEIARFVYSRKNGDENSQIVSISNSLWMLSSALLDEENIQVFNAECPHEKVSVVVNEPDELLNKNTSYIWSVSDPDLVISTTSTQYSNTNNKCIIKDASDDFSVSVYRYDATTGVRSNTVEIPISVNAFNTGFTIVHNNYEYDLATRLVVPPGSKIQLVNQTVNASEHLNQWVLQLQENFMGDGRIIEGTTSNLINPSCYLYNLGQHKIKLTITSKNGCNETVIAENIYVEGAQGRTMHSYFETEETYQIGNLWVQEVSPTLLNTNNDYTVYIKTNKQYYCITLRNLMGQNLITPITTSGNYALSLAHLETGYYLLRVDNQWYKIFKQ